MTNAQRKRHIARNRVRRQVIRAENIAQGLRHDGKPRRLKRWPELHGKSGQFQKNFHTAKWRRHLLDAGLTSNGTVRKYHIWRELEGLKGRARMNERERVFNTRYRVRRSRKKVAALIKGAKTILKLKAA